MANTSRAVVREAIHRRIRRKVRGSTARPRLAVYRSLSHIYAQVIDDFEGQTLVSASSTEKELRGATGGNLEAARRIGKKHESTNSIEAAPTGFRRVVTWMRPFGGAQRSADTYQHPKFTRKTQCYQRISATRSEETVDKPEFRSES